MVTYKKPVKMSKKVLKNIEDLKKKSDANIDYSDIPPLNKDQLNEIAKIVKERKERMQSVTLRLPPQVLERYKELGKGYTSVMAHILCDYVQS
jgi:uncharacterized protein (DUF4415 family)